MFNKTEISVIYKYFFKDSVIYKNKNLSYMYFKKKKKKSAGKL